LVGIYPRGDDSAVAQLLAPAFLKSSAETDPEICARYDIQILNLPITLTAEEMVQRILNESPSVIGFSTYI